MRSLLSVDADISRKIESIAADGAAMRSLESASRSIHQALKERRRIYLYGCGATGRLAKLIESGLWRPFWKKMRDWGKRADLELEYQRLEESVVGEMTGGDRALVSSLEGFEDLALIGRLQLMQHGIGSGDVVFAVTEGGETSSVIGAILCAAEMKNREPETLFFLYNNPDEVLEPFDRSRSVLKNPAVCKINLTTGPQALAGSTRMQATSIELFVLGTLFEDALSRFLSGLLSPEEMAELELDPSLSLKQRLAAFRPLQEGILNIAEDLAECSAIEAGAYEKKGRCIYFADEAIVSVFTDAAERSPTFRLHPLDPVDAVEPRSWIRIETLAQDVSSAWNRILKRPFCGLEQIDYASAFERDVQDEYLRKAALRSSKLAGTEQQMRYDFSHRPERTADFAIAVLMDGELHSESMDRYLAELKSRAPQRVIALVSRRPVSEARHRVAAFDPGAKILEIPIVSQSDPIGLKRHLGLKMALNAHSTAVMAKLGLARGNTMVNVCPGNLKLIGRATFLIQSHVNQALGGQTIAYAEANAVLFDAMEFVKRQSGKCPYSETALSIEKIIRSVRENKNISWEEIASQELTPRS